MLHKFLVRIRYLTCIFLFSELFVRYKCDVCSNLSLSIGMCISPKVTFFLFLSVAQTRIAHLLGVAGTDVPIQDIQKLMMPHKVA